MKYLMYSTLAKDLLYPVSFSSIDAPVAACSSDLVQIVSCILAQGMSPHSSLVVWLYANLYIFFTPLLSLHFYMPPRKKMPPFAALIMFLNLLYRVFVSRNLCDLNHHRQYPYSAAIYFFKPSRL